MSRLLPDMMHSYNYEYAEKRQRRTLHPRLKQTLHHCITADVVQGALEKMQERKWSEMGDTDTEARVIRRFSQSNFR